MTLRQYLMVLEKIVKNLTVNYISGVDERLFKISNLLHGALDRQKLGARPMHPPPNLALLSSPTSAITQPVYEYISYTKTTLQKVMNKPSVAIICFEI